ncbi:hypothetical protein ACTVOX_02350 [Serratia marcescens]|uniref:hypothetical protein n=1 Tax=Serratia marcescens TaxID=615 RepID=UPI003FA6C7C5
MKKERAGSFADVSKEPVIDRISMLIRKHRSRSAAARAWDVNINTLNSYFKNDVAPPMPRDNLLARIADCEGVSLEWLKYGESDELQEKTPKTTKSPPEGDKLSQMLDFLSNDEREQLATMLARKGIDTILYLLDEDNIKLLRMDRVMKEKVLGLQPKTLEEAARIDEEARECGSDTSCETLPQSLTSNRKQAG